MVVPKDREVFLPPHNENATCGVKSRPKLFLSHVRLRSSKIEKDVIKLEKNLGGIKDMRKLPGAIFVVDPNNERIAIREANTLGIPVIAVTDTNCDPEGVDYVVPGNDDAIKSIVLFTSYFSNSVVEGGSVAASKSKKSGQTKVERDAALEKEIISKYENDIDLKEEE